MAEKKKRLKCTFKDKGYRDKMRELIGTGASLPRCVSMTDWYYMERHAKRCTYCARRFARLAQKARKDNRYLDGPTVLR